MVAAKPRYGGRAVPTPNLLLMTPEGKLLAEVSNYATEEEVLKTMLAVLERHPDYNRPGEGEAELTSPVARAQLRIDLHDYAGAKKALAGAPGDEARYLRGHLARRERRWLDMERELGRIEDESLLDDVRMERAHLLWHEGKFELLAKQLKEFPRASNRYTEARYYEGLALYHQRRQEDALAVWKSTITGCAQDPWIYRADWAYTQVKEGGGRRGFFAAGGPKTSLLARIGYMGRRNPDLTR